ncbi:MAG: hypothetical protein CBD74_08085, partial [Saprospirales bacterium TMED214]
VGAYTLNQLLTGETDVFAIPTSASHMVDLTTIAPEAAAAGQMLPSSAVNYRAQGYPAYPLRGEFR